MAFIPWASLGDGSISWNDPVLTTLAKKHAATPPQIALATLLHLSPIILPKPGTSLFEYLRQNIATREITLDKEDTDRLWT